MAPPPAGPNAQAQRGATPVPLRNPTLPLVIMGAFLAIGLSALLPLVQSSGATSTAGEIGHLEQEKADWQTRLHELETDVASLGSLERIEAEARLRLKMVPPTNVHYLAVDAPPPAERRLPSRYLPRPPEPDDGGDSLWDKLTSWVP
jgi:cell division protein FtsL